MTDKTVGLRRGSALAGSAYTETLATADARVEGTRPEGRAGTGLQFVRPVISFTSLFNLFPALLMVVLKNFFYV